MFAYQAMVGASIPVSETAELRIGYRYFASADTHFDDAEISYGSHASLCMALGPYLGAQGTHERTLHGD